MSLLERLGEDTDKRGNGDIQTEVEIGVIVVSLGMPRSAKSRSKLEETKYGISCRASEGVWLSRQLDIRLLVSRRVRK